MLCQSCNTAAVKIIVKIEKLKMLSSNCGESNAYAFPVQWAVFLHSAPKNSNSFLTRKKAQLMVWRKKNISEHNYTFLDCHHLYSVETRYFQTIWLSSLCWLLLRFLHFLFKSIVMTDDNTHRASNIINNSICIILDLPVGFFSYQSVDCKSSGQVFNTSIFNCWVTSRSIVKVELTENINRKVTQLSAHKLYKFCGNCLHNFLETSPMLWKSIHI